MREIFLDLENEGGWEGVLGREGQLAVLGKKTSSNLQDNVEKTGKTNGNRGNECMGVFG
jgi:hypothetical protein